MNIIPKSFLFDDDFDNFFLPAVKRNNEMKCDIYEKDNKYHIEMDVPGFNKEDIKIDVEDGILTIEAEKSESKEDKEGKNYYRRERTYGSFKRQFNVGSVKEHEINAKFHNGVLKISFPKEEKKETKKFIEIK